MTTHRVRDQHLSRLGLTRRGLGVVGRTWLVVSAALLLVGAAVHFDLVTEDRLGPLAATSEVAAGETARLGGSGSDFESLPMVPYAGIEVALVEARAIPENLSGTPIIVVDLAVRNTSDVQARVPVSMIGLLGSDGVTTAADRFEFTDHGDRLVVESGQTQQGTVVFKLRPGSTPELERYLLEIAEQSRWPAYLPLLGEVPAPIYPQPLEVAFSDDQARYRDLTVELTDAVTALEYGVYRATVGQHLAVVTVTVTGSPASSFTSIDRDLWTLVDGDGLGTGVAEGGVERRAIRAVPGQRPVGGNTVTMELVFAYSTESSDLALLVGPADDRIVVAEFQVQSFE